MRVQSLRVNHSVLQCPVIKEATRHPLRLRILCQQESYRSPERDNFSFTEERGAAAIR